MWNSDEVKPEWLWLRVCCRYALGYMHWSDCVPYLKRSLNEERFMALLDENRLLLLVYQVLSKNFKAYVSSSLLDVLHQKSQAMLKLQLGLMSVEKSLNRALEKHNIPHVFLKGPALNQVLWGHQMMRYSGDMDLLILPKDIMQANTVLRALKFYPELSERALRVYQRFYRWSTRKDVVYWKQGLAQPIELHWKLYAIELLLDGGGSWVDSRVGLPHLPQLPDEEHALYLCLHAAKHGWSRIIWLVDIIALLNIKAMDISRLRRLAEARHITPVVDECILLAERWLGIALLPQGEMIALKKREQCLKQRLLLGKKAGKGNWARTLKKIYHVNSICSRPCYQIQVWLRIILGHICTRMFRLSK